MDRKCKGLCSSDISDFNYSMIVREEFIYSMYEKTFNDSYNYNYIAYFRKNKECLKIVIFFEEIFIFKVDFLFFTSFYFFKTFLNLKWKK